MGGPGKKDEDQVDNENAGEAGDDESRALTPKERKAAEKAAKKAAKAAKKAKTPKGHALKKICAEASEEADCPTDQGCEWRKPTKKECKPTKPKRGKKGKDEPAAEGEAGDQIDVCEEIEICGVASRHGKK